MMGIDAHSGTLVQVRLPRALIRVLLNGVLLLGSLVAALGVSEILIRIVAPQQLVLVRPDIWQPDDSLGYKFRPNLHTEANWGERTVHLYTDRDGFRVGAAGPRQGDTRVLLIGDSFMAALQVEYEQSLAALLEERLSKRLGKRVAVRNAGQDAYDPPQYFILARQLLQRDTFDLVVVSFFLGNDVVTTRPDRILPWTPVEIASFRLPRRWSWDEVVAAFLRPINDYLEARSYLFIFAKNRLQTLRMRVGLSAEYFPEEFLRREAASSRWDITADICRDIAGLAARRGIPTLFVLVPAPFQVDSVVFNQYLNGFGIDPKTVDLDQPDRLMGERLRARHLAVLHVLPAFRAVEDAGRQLYGRVDRHLSPAGHEKLDSLVEPEVVNILGRRTASRR